MCAKDHESEGGRTSLMRAAKNGHQLTVEFLVSKGLTCRLFCSVVTAFTVCSCHRVLFRSSYSLMFS